jgi:outer membrane protein insertion porin family
MQIFSKFLIFCLFFTCSSPLASAAVTSSSSKSTVESIELDEVSLVGITLYQLADLEKVIEISAGDKLDRNRILQTSKNIQDLYRSAGYEEVKIETRLVQRVSPTKKQTENVLEIVVSEGLPTRIGEIQVEYDLLGWADRLTSATSKIDLKSQDIYDREKLLNGFRALQDSLTAWDFLSAKIEESRVDQVSPPEEAVRSGLAKKTSRWVRVRVKVQLGDRVSFAFRGNTVFPNSQLASWIEEQRLLGFSQDYVERIRGRLEEEYRKLGYDRAKVKVYTFEDHEDQRRKVLYAFDEGPRVEIEKISFDGNAIFDAAILKEKFLEKAAPTVTRGYYVAKDVEQSAELLLEWLKSQGYLGAKLVSIARNYRSSGSKVDLVIYLYEGEQTIVDSVIFRGASVFPPNILASLIGNQAGKALNLYALNEGLEKLKAAYREQGYLDIKIENEGTNRLVLYSQENRVADIILEMTEGVQYKVSRIEVEGLGITKKETVMRELELREGDILSERDWYRSEAKLRRLGIFSKASIKAFPDPQLENSKILKILLEEGSPGLVAGGVGLRNDLGGRVFGQIQYSNLWGENHTVAFTANANRRFRNFGSEFCPNSKQQVTQPDVDHCFIEFNTSVGYVWPWFSFGDTTFRPRFSVERTQFKNFDADTYALQASWEKTLLKSWGLTGVFTYSLELIKQYNVNISSDEQRLRIGSISPTLILDRRNNPLAPSKGTYTTLQYDLARPTFGSQNSPPDDPAIAYWRMQFRNDLYVPLPKGLDFYFSFRTGLEYNLAPPPSGSDPTTLGSKYAIPLIKQFTLGGVGSLRGYSEQSLNAQNVDIRGSLTYVNYRAQLDLPFAGAMKFGPFVDAANLNIDRYNLGALRYGVGAGFHYKSPVGPVNFDIGVNPSPQIGDDSYKLHFSIGNI